MEAEKPELALLDLMLPGAEGVDLVQDILKIEDLPVVFVYAYGREDLVAWALDMGGGGLRGQALLAHETAGPYRGGCCSGG